MARHHVNPNTGNPGICKASKAGCPFGGESGEENHYSTAEEATQAAEKLMADQYSAVKSSYRKKDGSALAGMNREMKKRIISEAAEGKNGLHPSVVAKAFSKDNDELIRKNVSEKFKSQKILREMSTDESARVRLAVAKATNNPDVLKAMANDPDLKVRKAAIANAKTPVKVRKAALASLGVKKVKPTSTFDESAGRYFGLSAAEKARDNEINREINEDTYGELRGLKGKEREEWVSQAEKHWNESYESGLYESKLIHGYEDGVPSNGGSIEYKEDTARHTQVYANAKVAMYNAAGAGEYAKLSPQEQGREDEYNRKIDEDTFSGLSGLKGKALKAGIAESERNLKAGYELGLYEGKLEHGYEDGVPADGGSLDYKAEIARHAQVYADSRVAMYEYAAAGRKK